MRRTLTPKQILVLSALMSGLTNDEAARKAGVSGATVERYKADPNFQENMAFLASESLQLASERMVSAVGVAMDKLIEMIDSEDTKGADRLKAIELLLSKLETFGGVVARQRKMDERDWLQSSRKRPEKDEYRTND